MTDVLAMVKAVLATTATRWLYMTAGFQAIARYADLDWNAHPC